MTTLAPVALVTQTGRLRHQVIVCTKRIDGGGWFGWHFTIWGYTRALKAARHYARTVVEDPRALDWVLGGPHLRP